MHYEFPESRKEQRKKRKRISAKDRSKFKKTDLKKAKTRILGSDEFRGRVIAIFPEFILVDSGGKEYECVLRGTLKKHRTKQKNLIAVGDFVHFNAHGSILFVEPRYSILSRSEHFKGKKEQLIASNVDLVLITTSLFVPKLKPALIDRYIIAATKGNMQPIIVINKIDLLRDPPQDLSREFIQEEKTLFEEFMNIYKLLNISIICVSATSAEGLDALKNVMKGKVSVFSGQSGVGKSSIINALIGTNLRIGELIAKSKKGAHTTTHALLLPLPDNGFCIDTPGIKSFGLWELSHDEIKHYFQEIEQHSTHCHYPNCSHTHEPNCNVKQAVKNGVISSLRYNSYLSLMEEKS